MPPQSELAIDAGVRKPVLAKSSKRKLPASSTREELTPFKLPKQLKATGKIKIIEKDIRKKQARLKSAQQFRTSGKRKRVEDLYSNDSSFVTSDSDDYAGFVGDECYKGRSATAGDYYSCSADIHRLKQAPPRRQTE